jgi:uncharacterized coiled-coil protein SlyX
MGIADYDASDFEQGRQAEQDSKLLVKFYYRTVPDAGKSEEQGRAVFKEQEYVSVRVPGRGRSGAVRPATARDKKRFERHYVAFKQRVELPETGTPLSEWPVVSRSLSETLAFMGIKTVEHLANIDDNIASGIMGGNTLKRKANEWLERAKQDVSVDQLTDELAKRDTLIANMQEQLDMLTSEHKPKRKRRTPEEMKRDNQLSDIGERPAEPGSSGSGADTGS